MDLALNNLERLIRHKTQTTKPNSCKTKLFEKELFFHPKLLKAHLAGAIEYTDCISTEELGLVIHNKFPGYDTKQSDVEDSVMLEF